MSIYKDWIDAKECERIAVEKRREIEDKLIKHYQISEASEGSKSIKDEGYVVKVICRMNRTIDADLLQEIAIENGLTEHLGSLFRWKPEINTKAWKDADESITAPLLGAITTKPGRPSFSIELNDKQ